jgi:hypothetical protein
MVNSGSCGCFSINQNPKNHPGNEDITLFLVIVTNQTHYLFFLQSVLHKDLNAFSSTLKQTNTAFKVIVEKLQSPM